MRKSFMALYTMALLSFASFAEAAPIGYDFEIETKLNINCELFDKNTIQYEKSGFLTAETGYKESFDVSHDISDYYEYTLLKNGTYDVALTVENPVPGGAPIDLGLSFIISSGRFIFSMDPTLPIYVENQDFYLAADMTDWKIHEEGYYYAPLLSLNGFRDIGFEFGYIGSTDAPIPNPEPATLLLSGLGLAGIGYMKRRRNKQQ